MKWMTRRDGAVNVDAEVFCGSIIAISIWVSGLQITISLLSGFSHAVT
jgi:hypothetical protein